MTIDTLTLESDFRGFFHPKVHEDVRRAALRKLFAEPHFNVMDGLDTYIDDYSKTEPIPAAMLAGMKQAQRILDWRARHGRFRRIVDLRRVKGFGRKTVLRLAPFLVLDRHPDTPVPSAAPIPPRPISSPSLILPAGLTSSPPPSLSPLPLPSVSSSPGKGGPSK